MLTGCLARLAVLVVAQETAVLPVSVATRAQRGRSVALRVLLASEALAFRRELPERLALPV